MNQTHYDTIIIGLFKKKKKKDIYNKIYRFKSIYTVLIKNELKIEVALIYLKAICLVNKVCCLELNIELVQYKQLTRLGGITIWSSMTETHPLSTFRMNVFFFLHNAK